MRLITLLCLTVGLIAACAPKEHLDPLYKAKDYKFETITLRVGSTIKDIDPIEPTGIRRFIYKIPIINQILAIPLDLTSALLPPLPFKDEFGIPAEDLNMWSDPQFLALVKSLKLKDGWLRERSRQELIDDGKDPGDKPSWLCRKNRGIEFIKSMTVLFDYKDRRFPNQPPVSIPLAHTNNSKKLFDKEKRKMKFEIYDEDIRPMIENFNDFKLKLKAKGGLPCVRTYLEVGFEVEVVLQLQPTE